MIVVISIKWAMIIGSILAFFLTVAVSYYEFFAPNTNSESFGNYGLIEQVLRKY